MADPDVQIRGGGGAPGHPDPEIRGGGLQKMFSALWAWPQFGLKIRGGPGLPSSSRRSTTVIYKVGR